MISERQQDANRRNAAKSNGPKTPEGRAAVRHNALKHGFTAAEIVLPTVEEQIDFEQFRAAFEAEHQPVGPTEEVLVEDIVVDSLATQPHSQDGARLLRPTPGSLERQDKG